MSRRLLLIIIAIVLLAVVALGAAWFLLSRGATTEENGAAAGDGLPEAGTGSPLPEASPGTGTAVSLACPERWAGLPDSDNDGLPDEAEALYLTDNTNPDTDGDNHQDGEEARAGYDPLKSEGNPRLDSDSDGLRNDEECQWKTNPFIADTDGDGFPDGDEVRNGFDPTIKGNGKGSDALPERRARAAEQELETLRPRPDSDNLTERLAAQILGSRSSEEAGNLTVTPEELQRAVASAAFPLDTAVPEVPLAELSVGTTNTPPDIRRYLNAVDTVRPQAFNSSTVFADALTRATSGDTSSLALVRERLTQYEAELRAVVVPPSAVPYHRVLLGLVRFVLDRFTVVEDFGRSDPVRAYLALQEIQEGVRIHTDTVATLRAELDQLARASPGG